MAQQAQTARAWELIHKLVSEIEAYRSLHKVYPEDIKELDEAQSALVRQLEQMGCEPGYCVKNAGPMLGITIEGEQYWTYFFRSASWEVHSQYWSPIHER
jgi:hypothetical protein